MPYDQKHIADGDNTFELGMDASKRPSELSIGSYAKGINIMIPRSGGGLKQRGGIQHQTIDWSGAPGMRDTYQRGHIQGEGWFWNGFSPVLLRQINGRVLQLKRERQGLWRAKELLGEDPNGAKRTKCWFTRIPHGNILQDGESDAILIEDDIARRADTSAGEITAGMFGAYVQNRYFYADPTGVFIQAGDYDKPYSIAESSLFNVHGWMNPQRENQITAIGIQKQMLSSARSGVLAWSDGINCYSADVRGSRENWEHLGSGVGKVEEVVPGVGATSHYSFEPYNTNLYFRSKDFGLVDLRQSQFQFVGDRDLSSQSIEVDNWLENDTEWMLDQCYTRRYRSRLYTTVAPVLTEDGYTYWSGLLVAHPNPHNQETRERFPRRFEGIITGIRPWCMTVVERNSRPTEMFIDSRDDDGITRLYQYDERWDHDVRHDGTRIEIPSTIETRAYHGKLQLESKQVVKRTYSLGELVRDVNVQIRTRPEGYGQWLLQHDQLHVVAQGCQTPGAPLNPAAIKSQERKQVNVKAEPANDKENPDATHSSHYSRQYRFDIKGPFRLHSFINVSQITDFDKTVTPEEQPSDRRAFIYKAIPDFSYNIATANNNELISASRDTADSL